MGDAVLASALVGPGRPMRWEFDLLYLDRYRAPGTAGAGRPAGPARAGTAGRRRRPRWPPGWTGCSPTGTPAQRRAAELAAPGWTTVIGGGPGTGKTTTVARMLALLMGQPGPPPRVAMAAPTGKAAARLQEAVQAQALALPAGDRHDLPALTASTLHRLLGLAARPRPAVPARPGQPAAVRRHRRGRDVDGVVDDDGPAAGGRASRCPAHPGRRPGPAGLGGGRRRAGRPGRRVDRPTVGPAAGSTPVDGPDRPAPWSCWTAPGGSAAAIAELAAAVRDGDADAALSGADRRRR